MLLVGSSRRGCPPIAAGGFHSLTLASLSFFYGVEAVLDFGALTTQPLLLPQGLDQEAPIEVETTLLGEPQHERVARGVR
jgi:hypothetical protein